MPHVKTVGVRDLQNQLSAHLREVKAGNRVLVTERSTVIAELRPPGAEDQRSGVPSTMDDWVHAGRLVSPRSAKTPLPASPIRTAEGTAQRLMEEQRAE